MMYELYGIAFTLTSRVVSGEIELTENQRESLAKTQKSLRKVSDTLGQLDPSKPATWVQFGSRLLGQIVGEGDEVDAWEWLEKIGYGYEVYQLEAMWRQTFLRSKRELVYRHRDDVVWRVELPGGEHYYVEVSGRGRSRSGLPRYQPNLPNDEEARTRVLEAAGAAFWDGRSAMMLDVTLKNEVFTEIEVDGAEYHGPLRQCIQRWQRYARDGVRRNVLIQGKPGTGKSTFCLNAARQLSERTLVLTAESCDSLGDSNWYELLDVLKPTMVIMDDIDRLSEMKLERKLRMFEEGFCDVPFILFTSNDLERLPQPLRRPGRIDQILEVEEPSDLALTDVINRIAARERIELDAKHRSDLLKLARELSLAHVVERLRRARIEGWDAEPIAGDITFTSGYLGEDEEAEEVA